MKIRGTLTAFILIFTTCAVSCAAQTKNEKQPAQANEKTTKPMNETKQREDDRFEILAGNLMGNLEEPLIFAARDAATYELLKKVVPELPAAKEINFQTNAVVAAFLGTKPTAGFDVSINKAANNTIKIEMSDRPQGAMVAQVLTTPFKVALVPAAADKPLSLDFGSVWKNTMRFYRVTSGEFGYSGGIAGTKKQFNVEGTIGVLRVGDLITIDLILSGKAAEKSRTAREIVSGEISGEKITLSRFGGGNLIEQPHPAVSGEGILNADNLTLIFKSQPTDIADGYSGEGQIKAVKIVK